MLLRNERRLNMETIVGISKMQNTLYDNYIHEI